MENNQKLNKELIEKELENNISPRDNEIDRADEKEEKRKSIYIEKRPSFSPFEILNQQKEKLRQRRLSRSQTYNELDKILSNINTDFNNSNNLITVENLPTQNGSTNLNEKEKQNENDDNDKNYDDKEEKLKYLINKIPELNGINNNYIEREIKNKENIELNENHSNKNEVEIEKEKLKFIELNMNHLKSLESIDENCYLNSNDLLQCEDNQTEEKIINLIHNYNQNDKNNYDHDNYNDKYNDYNDNDQVRINLPEYSYLHENQMEEKTPKKGAFLFHSVQQRKNYEEKISILKTRLKKLKDQEDELSKRLVIEKNKIIKSQQIRNGVLENKKRIQKEKEQRELERERLKQNVHIEKEMRQIKINDAKNLMKNEKTKKFQIVKKDKILIDSMKQSLRSQMNNMKNYQYFKNKQEEISMKVKRFQEYKEKEDMLKNKYDSKIELEIKKTFDLKTKLGKLEEQEMEYLKKVENTIMRNTMEIESLKNKNILNNNNDNKGTNSNNNTNRNLNLNSMGTGNNLNNPIGTPKHQHSHPLKINFASCPKDELEVILDGENEENENYLSNTNKKDNKENNLDKIKNDLNQNLKSNSNSNLNINFMRTASQKIKVLSKFDYDSKNPNDKNSTKIINGAEKMQMKKHGSLPLYDFDKKYLQNDYLTHQENTNKKPLNNINSKNKTGKNRESKNLNQDKPEWKNISIKNKDVNKKISVKIGNDKEKNIARKINFADNTPKTTKNNSISLKSNLDLK
jgi:hypothetical protein